MDATTVLHLVHIYLYILFLFLRCGVLLACIGPEMSRMYRHCNFLIMNSLCLCCVPVDIFFLHMCNNSLDQTQLSSIPFFNVSDSLHVYGVRCLVPCCLVVGTLCVCVCVCVLSLIHI